MSFNLSMTDSQTQVYGFYSSTAMITNMFDQASHSTCIMQWPSIIKLLCHCNNVLLVIWEVYSRWQVARLWIKLLQECIIIIKLYWERHVVLAARILHTIRHQIENLSTFVPAALYNPFFQACIWSKQIFSAHKLKNYQSQISAHAANNFSEYWDEYWDDYVSKERRLQSTHAF